MPGREGKRPQTSQKSANGPDALTNPAALQEVAEQIAAAVAIRSHGELVRGLAETTDIGAAMGQCLEYAVRAAGMDAGAAYLIFPDEGASRLVHEIGSAYSPPPRLDSCGSERCDSCSLQQGTPLFLDRDRVGEAPHRELLHEGIRSMAIIPVTHGGVCLACVVVASMSRDEIPDSAKASLEILTTLMSGAFARIMTENRLRRTMRVASEIVAEIPTGFVTLRYSPPDCFYVLDANPEAERISRIPLGSVRGKEIGEIWPHSSIGGLISEMTTVMRTGVTRDFESVEFEPEGSRLLIQVRVFRLSEDRLAVAFEDVTERVRTERELRETRERYRYIAGAVTDYLYTVRLENGSPVETAHGPASLAVTGYSPEELQADPLLWITMVPEEDRDAVRAHADAILTDEFVQPLEHRIVRKDGRTVWVRNTQIRHYDEQGRLTSYDGLVQNIDEQRRIEEARRLSEEKYRLVVENADEGICVARGGKLVFANTALCSLTGYSREELEGSPISKLVHPEAREMIVRRHFERLSGGDPERVYRLRCLTKDGQARWLQVSETSIKWESEPAVLTFLTDLTELLRTGEELNESRRVLYTLMQNLSGMVYRCCNDQNWTMEFISEGCLELTGYRPADLKGNAGISFGQIIHPEDRELVRSEVDSALKDGRRFRILYRISTRDGRTKWVLEQGSGVIDHEGSLIALEGFIADTTELVSAREAAVAADNAKSDFLATMSHEIRTPLNAVIGMSGLLAETSLDDREKEYVRVIQSSAVALLTVINDILDFSKIEAGKLDLECIPFDVRVTLADVGGILEDAAAKKGLALTVIPHHSLPDSIVGDEGRLRQILLNLTNNAVKFTSSGEIVVSAWTGSTQCGGATLCFEVADTGIGIPEDRRDRLFRSFSQVDASTTRKHGGTGLGLAISRSLVRMMGGEIGVYSRPEEGSVFWFAIRMPVSMEGRPEIRVTSRCSTSNPRLLLVDDDTDRCKQTLRNLHEVGFAADVAWSCEEALAALAQRPYSAVLVACASEGPDLRKTVRRIRAMFLSDPVPAILGITWERAPILRSKPSEAHTDALVRLPLQSDAIPPVLRSLLKPPPDAEADPILDAAA